MQQLQTYDNDFQLEEIKLDRAIQNFLERRDYEFYNVSRLEQETNEDIEFVKISHISYDRNKSETDLNLIDLQQVLNAISSKAKKFVYMIESSENGVDLYLGTQKNSTSFLQNSFEGIYSGSEVKQTDKKTLLKSKMNYTKAMLGIPALKRDSDKEYKQSLEKILFPMQGKKFRIVLVAQAYELATIQEIISNYQTLGDEIHKFVKQSKNIQQSNADSRGVTLTKGSSESETGGSSETNSTSSGTSDKTLGSKIGTTLTTAIGAGVGFLVAGPGGAAGGAAIGGMVGSNFFSKTETENSSNSYTINSSRTNSTNQSTSTNNNTTKTDTIGITFDEVNKSAEFCEELVDKYIERFQKGLNHGMWNSSLYIQAEDEVVLSELEHTLKSVYSGDESYYEPIRFSQNISDFKTPNLPMLYFDDSIKHPVHISFTGFSSAVNTEELSILSALPNNDVDGISVSKISSFGLTQTTKKENIEIGNISNKKKIINKRFKLSLEDLNSHLFVSGITGSGKSNTVKLILKELQSKHIENKIPFLIIEPAKSEYKNLLNDIPNLQIFRPGAKDDLFKLNPFVFEHNRENKSISLTKHVDMLKVTFSSAFPMYGPMPYILEEAIYEIYKDKGWDFDTEDNPYYTDLKSADYDRKSLLFPNMNDLKEKIETVVKRSGYAGELDSNIKAALKTRIGNLTIGAKGKIFNSRHSLDSSILFEKPTIIELSYISNDEEKSFLMGLLLNKLYQYREEQGNSNNLKHITVIEEAHRLLPNVSFDTSNEEANAKAKAVETFTNVLSEIRSYGEGIIIVDQIASKLHRDVVKNTNIKIIQRTMDKEDRELVGNAINLDEDQILDIAELQAGEAIVHSRDVHQPFMVKIDEVSLKDISNELIEKFNDKFLDRHREYRYELIDEHNFALDVSKRGKIKALNKELLKSSMLKVLNCALVDSSDDIFKYWDNFKNNLKDVEDEKIYFYLALEAFYGFNCMSSIQYYNSIDNYLRFYDNFLFLINILINNDKANLVKVLKEFKQTFRHKNIKTTLPSMKYFSDYEVDYTLLILENLTTDEENYSFLKETMKKENLSRNEKFDKILHKIFNTTSPTLRYALGAIRIGSKEIDFNSIVKKGF